MTWKAWKRGLCVSALSGTLSALIALGVVEKITWRELAFLLAIGAAKDALIWIKQNPFERVEHTQFITKKGTK